MPSEMTRETRTRRRFGIAIATGAALGLAGCQDLTNGDDGNGGNGDDGNGGNGDDGNGDDGTAGDGTAGDGDDGSGDDGMEPPEQSELTIYLENENGEPVTSGVAVTVETDDRRANLGDDSNEDGVMTLTTSSHGEFTITAESTEDEFEPVEETVTVEEGGEAEVTLTLEGAPGGDEGDGTETGDS